MSRDAEAGFTLIEMVVALGLSAIVALAGVTLLDTVLGVERRTAGQLDHLADLQRTMAVVARDLDSIAAAPLTGDATGIAFDRRTVGGHRVAVRYAVGGGTLERIQAGRMAVVLDHVTGTRWTYLGAAGWQTIWPAEAGWPRAVEVEVDIDGGTLRRVVDLPERARR